MMSSFKILYYPIAMLILLGVAMLGCEKSLSDEEQVRQFLARAVMLSETRDVAGISGIIAEDYLDAEQRKQRDLIRMAMGYFLRNKNIHLFSRIDSIHFPEVGKAQVQLNIAMAGQPVQNLESLLNIRAELMTFHLTLIKDVDSWLLQSAQWRRATMEDFSGKHK